MCTSCHDLEVLNGRRETAERWGEIVEDMFVRGAKGTPQQIDAVVAYLAKYFGKRAGGRITAPPGAARIGCCAAAYGPDAPRAALHGSARRRTDQNAATATGH